MPKRQSARIDQELVELAQVLEGARVLCDLQRQRALPGPEEERIATRAYAALVSIVAARLRLLGGR